jgi:phosphoserine phosphatase
MKYKDFSPDLISEISSALKLQKAEGKKLVAAFDADGTLWDTDIGEAFFDYLIKTKKVRLPQNPWNFYLDLKNKKAVEAYYWLCEILEGLPLSLVKTWAKEAIDLQHPIPIFPQQQKLIEFFQSNQVEIYVVTASVKWSVEPAAALLGITPSHVLGIATTITAEGLVTKNRMLPPTYREGKPQVLIQHTNGVLPFFCCGNSMGDKDLLEIARLKLAVSSSANQPGLKDSESELQDYALKNRWLRHSFV